MRAVACGPAAVLLLLLAAAAAVEGSKRSRHGLVKQPIPDELRYHPNHTPSPVVSVEELPKDLDWCNKDGTDYCTSSWNQHIPHYCGSCYLHATLSMIGDRIKIAKQGSSPDTMLGRQSFLNCAPHLGYSGGCDGGDVIDVVRYMADVGLPDEGCMPYSATDYSSLGLARHGGSKCPAKAVCLNCMPDDDEEGGTGKDDCWAVRTPVLYKVSAYGNVGATHPDPGNVAAMMSELHHRGPITCSIACPDSLVWEYDGGIFRDTTGDTDVDHDVEIVGYGEEDGVPFWKVRNSWGGYWGVNGFFRLERGVNALQIEAGDCWYATPTWDMEQEVASGDLLGSMYGVYPKGTPPPGRPHGGASSGAAAAAAAAVEDEAELQRARGQQPRHQGQQAARSHEGAEQAQQQQAQQQQQQQTPELELQQGRRGSRKVVLPAA